MASTIRLSYRKHGAKRMMLILKELIWLRKRADWLKTTNLIGMGR